MVSGDSDRQGREWRRDRGDESTREGRWRCELETHARERETLRCLPGAFPKREGGARRETEVRLKGGEVCVCKSRQHERERERDRLLEWKGKRKRRQGGMIRPKRRGEEGKRERRRGRDEETKGPKKMCMVRF